MEKIKNFSLGVTAITIKIGGKLLGVLAKLAKTSKLVKVGLVGASVASYSYLYNWKFAVLILVSIFVHESGHIWAMKRRGMKTKGIYFIPFFGAAAVAEDMFPTREAESYVAIMGPIWGLGLAAITAVVYMITKEPLFAASASWMAALNLFNLLPINPLDGGRIAKSIAYSIGNQTGFVVICLSMMACAVLTFGFGYYLFVFLFLIGSLELALEYKLSNKLGTIHRIPTMNGKKISLVVFIYATTFLALMAIVIYMQSASGITEAMEFLRE